MLSIDLEVSADAVVSNLLWRSARNALISSVAGAVEKKSRRCSAPEASGWYAVPDWAHAVRLISLAAPPLWRVLSAILAVKLLLNSMTSDFLQKVLDSSSFVHFKAAYWISCSCNVELIGEIVAWCRYERRFVELYLHIQVNFQLELVMRYSLRSIPHRSHSVFFTL